MTTLTATSSPPRWYLCGRLHPETARAALPVHSPFVIGRKQGLGLTVASRYVSSEHAELSICRDRLFVRDLGSRNGTWLNGERITRATQAGVGDLLRIADIQLRVDCRSPGEARWLAEGADLEREHAAWIGKQVETMLREQSVTTVVQPILSFDRDEIIGFEAFARSDVSGLETPAKIFEAGRVLGCDVELSLLCRKKTLEAARQLGAGAKLFLNTHRAENLATELLPSLRALRDQAPDVPFVVELPQAHVRSLAAFSGFVNSLPALNVEWAFDQFAFEHLSFLRTLLAPPGYVKFCRVLTQNLSRKSELDRQQLQNLVQAVKMLGLKTVAQAVGTPDDALACREAGFDCIQGNAVAPPAPLPSISMAATEAFTLAESTDDGGPQGAGSGGELDHLEHALADELQARSGLMRPADARREFRRLSTLLQVRGDYRRTVTFDSL